MQVFVDPARGIIIEPDFQTPKRPVMSAIINGIVLGWSVSWPPGPVNAEMIRRSLRPKTDGGGFWPAWVVGIGACIGDFTWAFGVSLGAGAALNAPLIRRTLAIVSLGLLSFLAFVFTRSAWRILRNHRAEPGTEAAPARRSRSGLLIGFSMAVSSPWNLGFWLAVVGSQSAGSSSIAESVVLAGAVVCGALIWTLVLCVGVKLAADIFARPEWQVTTEIVTAGVMLWFAIRLLRHFP